MYTSLVDLLIIGFGWFNGYLINIFVKEYKSIKKEREQVKAFIKLYDLSDDCKFIQIKKNNQILFIDRHKLKNKQGSLRQHAINAKFKDLPQ